MKNIISFSAFVFFQIISPHPPFALGKKENGAPSLLSHLSPYLSDPLLPPILVRTLLLIATLHKVGTPP